jgi:chromosome partitioning protein
VPNEIPNFYSRALRIGRLLSFNINKIYLIFREKLSYLHQFWAKYKKRQKSLYSRKISFNLNLMDTIAISNLKGNCAKTAAVNLAGCLGGLNKKVLEIDLDPQGSASQWLSLQGHSNFRSLDLFLNKEKVETLVQSSLAENRDLISATQDLYSLEKSLAGEFAIESTLKKCLSQQPPSNCDFVLIDTPPTLGLVTVNPPAVAGQLLIPAPKLPTLSGAA